MTENAALGIYYEITTTLDTQKQVSVRSERYALQAVARHILPAERVAICLRNRRSKDTDIEVWRHLVTNKAFYAGLLVCGSVWHCPVCAAKISERRREEMKHVFDAHLASEGHCTLLTLTFRHKRNDRLRVTLERFTKALQRFKRGKRFDALRGRLGLIGDIRGFEVTYGKNGFHPHMHIVLFHSQKLDKFDMEEVRIEMTKLWIKACAAYDLETLEHVGLTVQDAKEASSYITKWGEEKERSWGIDRELTKSHIKKGRQDGLTPFDFLRIILEDGDADYVDLFQEYAEAMKGRQQLKYSKGLKKLYAIPDKTDEQLAVEKTEEADLLGIIPYYLWQKILRSDERANFLQLCENNDFDTAVSVVNKKREFPKIDGNPQEVKTLLAQS